MTAGTGRGTGDAPAGVIRRGDARDVRFLRDMLRHAYYWRASDPAAAELPVSRYVDGWGRRGDAALIALDAGAPVGAAWYRLFSRSAPGFGFVDESTPELTIAVVPSRRGRGFGAVLLEALLEQARADGFAAISLSVDRDNPAVQLYRRYGFVEVAERGRAWTMRAPLAESTRQA